MGRLDGYGHQGPAAEERAMAIMRCRACEEEHAVGFLPTGTSGLRFVPALAAGALTLTLAPATSGVRTVVAAALAIAWTLVCLHYGLHGIEYLLVSRRACPDCGARRWSFPYTRGFGA